MATNVISKLRMGGPVKRDTHSLARGILDILQRSWPDATCELDFEDAYLLPGMELS